MPLRRLRWAEVCTGFFELVHHEERPRTLGGPGLSRSPQACSGNEQVRNGIRHMQIKHLCNCNGPNIKDTESEVEKVGP